MTDNTFDYALQCQALQELLAGEDILVTQWRGTEAVSRPYRFEITIAVRSADLPLENLLDKPATLRLRRPDGSVARWHGIITQGAEHGHDEVYDYYQLILEPRLARLALRQWSDIYLDQQLDDLIESLLRQGQLTEKYYNDDAPYDYRIAVQGQDLSSMRRPFVCQFEENCLDFLMRKLEYYGVYFWFEQGEDRESIVFANDASQQPAQVDSAIYYPKGVLDPDTRHIVLTRMDRRVTMRPAAVSLRALHEPENTLLHLQAGADVPASHSGQGEIFSAADHFAVLDGDSGGANGVPGDTLARWRAQELACQSLGVRGDARTPGVTAGRFLAVSVFQQAADSSQYYIVQVEHEGTQTLDTAPGGETPSYLARFTALPRWRDQAQQDDPIQFRPARKTPVPRVTRLMSGFVDMDDKAGAKRYAQPDDQGRYKIRLAFTRQRYDSYRNSAWLRLSTPYAAGASQKGLTAAGMHFPLREGTEVLIAFLNGDPDMPVIVGSLPNAEAPSVVNQNNSREHVVRTPGGAGFTFLDGASAVQLASSEEEGEESSEDGNNPEGYEADETRVTISAPTSDAVLNLGAPEEEEGKRGFLLATSENGEIYSGESILIEVPNKLTICAGGPDKISSLVDWEKSSPNGHAVIENTMAVNVSNYVGGKVELMEGLDVSVTFGVSTEVFAGIKYSLTFSGGREYTAGPSKDIKIMRRTELNNDKTAITRKVIKFIKEENAYTETVTHKTLKYDTNAYVHYNVDSPNVDIGYVIPGARCKLSINAAGTTLCGNKTIVSATSTLSLSGNAGLSVKSGVTEMDMNPAGSIKIAGTVTSLQGRGSVEVEGELIKLG
ncbi:type VI secretion system Vgr family protein [Pollutimonas harenae]|uniref:Type VI secretion system tip protein VgrG n=1 Tax=Pollutimonas harenae TaxID=657015 RepID=A0A853GYE3_9BURK|nr:type VI secretion system Vgr family protein [Pollutimonas harenae]NYT85132.1 type VI secretion system tip protein VgrG [Pollutimonas harenae]TEA72486.1 type VI secretion system tip protein VgrG [Pollutimonas harenae]